MQSVLTQAPYNLKQNDLVVAIIKASNQIGWAHDYSDENTDGARI